jgi:hypothetical protein
MSNLRGVRVLRRLLSALVVVATVPVFVVVPAAVSRADGTVHTGKLTSSLTKVTTSTGRKVLVRVTGLESHDDEGGGTGMTVQIWTLSRTESHQWYPNIPYGSSGDFDYTDDGYATVAPATTAYYSVDLQFTPTSKPTTVCGSTDKFKWETKRTGQLSGMLFIDTHTEKWGTIGNSTQEDFTFDPGSTMRIRQGYSIDPCAVGGAAPCAWHVAAYHYLGNRSFVATAAWHHGSLQGHLMAGRTRKMPDAAADRLDMVTVSAPLPTFRLKNHRARVRIRTSANAASGSATVISSSNFSHGTVRGCPGGDRSYRDWPGDSLKNGRTPLTFHTVVFRDIHIADASGLEAPDVYYASR